MILVCKEPAIATGTLIAEEESGKECTCARITSSRPISIDRSIFTEYCTEQIGNVMVLYCHNKLIITRMWISTTTATAITALFMTCQTCRLCLIFSTPFAGNVYPSSSHFFSNYTSNFLLFFLFFYIILFCELIYLLELNTSVHIYLHSIKCTLYPKGTKLLIYREE